MDGLEYISWEMKTKELVITCELGYTKQEIFGKHEDYDFSLTYLDVMR